jgi:hypothetical protein
MNRLDKKQIFLGTILGIILSILTLILLTRNIQPLSAQQTTQKYTVFKSQNLGFKFVNLSGLYLPIFAHNIIIPYNVFFWVNVPEKRGDPYDPIYYPGEAWIDVYLCTRGESTNGYERLSYKVKIGSRNDPWFKIVSPAFPIGTLVDEYEFNSGMWTSNPYYAGSLKYLTGNQQSYDFVRVFGCPKKIWAMVPTIMSVTDAGVENEKRYLNIAILRGYVSPGPNDLRVSLKVKWSSRGGPYKVPINVTIFASY